MVLRRFCYRRTVCVATVGRKLPCVCSIPVCAHPTKAGRLFSITHAANPPPQTLSSLSACSLFQPHVRRSASSLAGRRIPPRLLGPLRCVCHPPPARTLPYRTARSLDDARPCRWPPFPTALRWRRLARSWTPTTRRLTPEPCDWGAPPVVQLRGNCGGCHAACIITIKPAAQA